MSRKPNSAEMEPSADETADADAQAAAEAEPDPSAEALGGADAAPEIGAHKAEIPAEPTPEETIAALNDQLLRALAETDNVRKRAAREREDTAKYAISGFAREVLAVADNLNRALDAARTAEGGEHAALEGLRSGVEVTERDLKATLERFGIREIMPLGKKFDHNLHQALFEVEDTEAEPGTVVRVVQAGYVIADRLLRPAMVGIAKGPAAEGEPAPEEQGAGMDTEV